MTENQNDEQPEQSQDGAEAQSSEETAQPSAPQEAGATVAEQPVQNDTESKEHRILGEDYTVDPLKGYRLKAGRPATTSADSES